MIQMFVLLDFIIITTKYLIKLLCSVVNFGTIILKPLNVTDIIYTIICRSQKMTKKNKEIVYRNSQNEILEPSLVYFSYILVIVRIKDT